jgi:hypothetical protein
MEQMTWRAPADLIDRVRRAAQRQHRSMNDYVTAVLDAATNPRLAGDEAERLRERLDLAGLLAEPGEPHGRPPLEAVASARRRAGKGTPLSQLITEDR